MYFIIGAVAWYAAGLVGSYIGNKKVNDSLNKEFPSIACDTPPMEPFHYIVALAGPVNLAVTSIYRF